MNIFRSRLLFMLGMTLFVGNAILQFQSHHPVYGWFNVFFAATWLANYVWAEQISKKQQQHKSEDDK